MTRVMLLRALGEFTLDATRDLLLPVRVQSAEEEPQERPAEVHLMRLPDSSEAKKIRSIGGMRITRSRKSGRHSLTAGAFTGRLAQRLPWKPRCPLSIRTRG